MKLIPRGSNQNSVVFDDGTEVFFSYNTPVAGYTNEDGFVRTNKQWSVTTSKHINKYLFGANAKEVEQSYMDKLQQR